MLCYHSMHLHEQIHNMLLIKLHSKQVHVKLGIKHARKKPVHFALYLKLRKQGFNIIFKFFRRSLTQMN